MKIIVAHLVIWRERGRKERERVTVRIETNFSNRVSNSL